MNEPVETTPMTGVSFALAVDGSILPEVTPEYRGILNLDNLIAAVMNAHGPRLAHGRYHSEYWAYKNAEVACRVSVRCAWKDQTEKLGILAFSILPVPCMNPDEIIWIADVNLHEVAELDESSSSKDALLIVSYCTNGVYPIVFPYDREPSGAISYDEPLFQGATIPDGFVNLALKSIFVDDKEMAIATKAALDGTVVDKGKELSPEELEERRLQSFQARHIAAAIASTYGHEVVFPGEATPVPALNAPKED